MVGINACGFEFGWKGFRMCEACLTHVLGPSPQIHRVEEVWSLGLAPPLHTLFMTLIYKMGLMLLPRPEENDSVSEVSVTITKYLRKSTYKEERFILMSTFRGFSL